MFLNDIFMTKIKCLYILLSIFSYNILGQIVKPISWEFTTSNQSPKVGDTVILNFTGKIKSGWHLYSNDYKVKNGPNIFTINFNKSTDYQLIGEPKAIGDIKKFDKDYDGTVRFFKKNCHFQQKVKILKKDLKISGDYVGQVCTDIDGVCSQNIGQFSFQLK